MRPKRPPLQPRPTATPPSEHLPSSSPSSLGFSPASTLHSPTVSSSTRLATLTPCPTFTPPPASILDYTAYPHLVDAILSYLPHNALLALRGTSSAFRAHIDALLSLHIILLDQFPPLRSAYGRHPAMLRRRQPSPGSPSTTVWPGRYPWSNFDTTNVRVIDFVGFNLTSVVEDLPERLGNVETVRMWGSPCPYLTTIVQPEEYIIFPKDPLLQSQAHQSPPRPGPCNPNLRRVVLNLFSAPIGPSFAYIEELFKHSNLMEVVVRFPTRRVDLVDKTFSSPSMELVPRAVRIIELALRAWKTFQRLVTITLVNPPTAPISLSGNLLFRVDELCSWGRDVGVNDLLGLTRALRRHDYPRVMEAEPYELLSIEEYEAKVGREQFLLETDPKYKVR